MLSVTLFLRPRGTRVDVTWHTNSSDFQNEQSYYAPREESWGPRVHHVYLELGGSQPPRVWIDSVQQLSSGPFYASYALARAAWPATGSRRGSRGVIASLLTRHALQALGDGHPGRALRWRLPELA